MIFDEVTIYKNNDHFFFERGQTLSKVCNAPDAAGIYLVYMLRKGKVRLTYVGASGTVSQSGKFKGQTLRGRINNKQDGVRRQFYFEEVMLKNEIDALDIYWYVTFNEDVQHIPTYVEGVLLQKYFEVHGSLPPWNKEF